MPWCSTTGNAIEPAIDPVEKKLFADWRSCKAAHAMLFERIDRQFLEYHQEPMSPYRGTRSKVFETDKYPSREALFADLFKRIQEGRLR